MAEYETRRVTTTRTVRTEGAHEFRSNLQSIAAEIARVRDQARAEVGALDKIRSMLDADSLSNLLRSVEQLEERIHILETETQNASSTAERLQAELDQERSRLEKLWAAYKAQEDELARVKRDYPLMEEKLFERERTIEALRRDIARLEQLSKYKGQYEDAIADNRRLQKEIEGLDHELQRALDALRSAEREVGELRELQGAPARVAELERLLDEERERLAKLYKVYEDLEADKRQTEETIARWEAWFARIEPSLRTLCSSASDAPR